MFRRYLRVSFGVAFVIAIAAVGRASAQTLSVAELTDAASLVVTGRVQNVTTQWDRQVNGIYTYAAIDVAEVWKGQLSTRQLVLKVLGGRVGDIELAIVGQARLAAGTYVALWLEIRPRDGTLYPAALAAGVRELGDPTLLDSLRTTVRSRPLDIRTPSFLAVPPEWHPMLMDAFTYGPPPGEGGPARWHEADSGSRVFVDYQSPPAGFGGGVTEIDNAIVAWNTTGMNLQLQIGGARGPRCLATYENSGDGRITVSFGDPCGELAPFGATLGVGGGYFTAGDLRTVSGVEFKKFLQGAVTLSNSSKLSERGCFQDAITHNLGHAIGLGDSNVESALMSPTYESRCGATPSALSQDDRDGARSIYPTGLSNAVPGPPTNLTGSATGTTVNLTWSAPALGGQITTYVVEAGINPGQPLITVPTNSTATTATFTDVPPGFYYVRVRGRNSFATGNPSNEIGLAVACAAPSAPANFAFTAAGNNVTLTWTPVSGAISYTLDVGSKPGTSDLLSHQFGPSTSLSATGAPGTYYARLHARSACGTSAASNEVTITLPAACVTPSAPQNFTHTVAANGVVSLNWAAPASGTGPFTYTIEAGSLPGLADVVVSNVGGVTNLTVQAPSGTYSVRVRAVNACGTEGPGSTEQTVVVP